MLVNLLPSKESVAQVNNVNTYFAFKIITQHQLPNKVQEANIFLTHDITAIIMLLRHYRTERDDAKATQYQTYRFLPCKTQFNQNNVNNSGIWQPE